METAQPEPLTQAATETSSENLFDFWSHLFWLSSAIWWYPKTSFWFPDEIVYILQGAKPKHISDSVQNTLLFWGFVLVFHTRSPLAWSLSSWLAVFFHSSIRSWSGVTRPSIRALKQHRDKTWWHWAREPKNQKQITIIYFHITDTQWRLQNKRRRDGVWEHNNPLRAGEERKLQWKGKIERKGGTYLVKWRNFASMLRWRMHILVRAEPTSLVAPKRKREEQIFTCGTRDWQYKNDILGDIAVSVWKRWLSPPELLNY